MKELFIGYHKKDKEEIKSLWDDAVFAFDTNVLLNLYRYSHETKTTILKLIEKLSHRMILPHQAAFEYNNRRIDVIYDIISGYRDFLKRIESIQEEINSQSKIPFLSGTIDTEFNSVLSKVTEDINRTIKKYESLVDNDHIYNEISELFSGKVVGKFSNDRLDELFKEAEKRFKLHIPPGYADAAKPIPNRYGDFLIWMQLIDFASENEKNIVFISDDKKEDWWWNLKDKKIFGPRQELIEEMKEKANVKFHMYTSMNFYRHGQKHFELDIDDKALKEIELTGNTYTASWSSPVAVQTEIFDEQKSKNKQAYTTREQIQFLKERTNELQKEMIDLAELMAQSETTDKSLLEKWKLAGDELKYLKDLADKKRQELIERLKSIGI